MFKFNQLRSIQIEITSRCQVSCPMCGRNVHGGLKNPNLKLRDWTLDDFKQIFNDELLNQLKIITFCGNYGDPIINDYLIEMCNYITEKNLNIEIGIHTNGSARSTEWWKQLAKSLPRTHHVFISIDGLEDTNHLYRIGADYNKIIDNAKAFISEGGNAFWTFLKFRHNEHQVEEARRRAAEIGFSSFVLKTTYRYLNDPYYKVLDKEGNILYYLEPPSDYNDAYVSKTFIDNFETYVGNAKISCQSLKEKELFIDCEKKVFPCCYYAYVPMSYNYGDENVKKLRDKGNKQVYSFINKLKTNNALEVSIKEIIETEEWQTEWDNYWNGKDKSYMCVFSCGKIDNVPSMTLEDQYLEIVGLER